MQERRGHVLWPYAGVALLGAALALGRYALAQGAAPGSAQDPLVTKSYVDQAIQAAVGNLTQGVVEQLAPQVANQVQGLVSQEVPAAVNAAVQQSLPAIQSQVTSSVTRTLSAQLAEQVPSTVSSLLPRWTVVTVNRGQTLIGSAGTEIVVRAGAATAVGSRAGGVADLTAGRDLATGAPVPLDHLLLVPRADGRGIASQGGVVALVYGSYTLQGS